MFLYNVLFLNHSTWILSNIGDNENDNVCCMQIIYKRYLMNFISESPNVYWNK